MRFLPEDIQSWSSRSFKGETQYTLVEDGEPPQTVIKASSQQAASGLFYDDFIDLEATPWLSWSWMVDTFPTIQDEKTKIGGDFAVRIYVVFYKNLSPLSPRTISYVWSQQSQLEESWANPFVGERAMMLSVESSLQTVVWKHQQRNVKADLKRLFGEDVRYLAGIALMSDADNSESTAIAYYKNLIFSAAPSASSKDSP